MTLDTLPALPLLVFEGKTIVITDANGEYVAETDVIETAQALVSLVNSAAAMREALRSISEWADIYVPRDIDTKHEQIEKALAALALIEDTNNASD